MDIDKDIPLPPIRAFSGKMKQVVWERMDVGDSVHFPASKAKAAYTSAKAYEYRHTAEGWRCTSRKDAGGIRIWRTA